MSPAGKTPYVLYRIYDDNDDGILLYVGATTNPGMRFGAHAKSQSWWPTATRITLEHFGSFDQLAAAERSAIRREQPIYNCVHGDIPMCSPLRRPKGETGVFQRGDGMWVGSVELPAGPSRKRRQKRVYSKDRHDAELKLAALKEAVAMGDIT